MKTKVLMLLLLFSVQLLMAQNGIGIGTTTPHSSAALDISSNGKGFLVPRLTQAARLAIPNPTNGLLVYDSTSQQLYQFQKGEWRFMLTNASWAQSSTRNYTYNTASNVGLGVLVPTEKLDVNGKIRARGDVIANSNIVAGGDISAASISATGSAFITEGISTEGIVTTYSSLNLDDADATVQLQTLNSKKGFFQLAGNNFRFGTNSGNAAGKIIFRMDQKDVMSIDRDANIDLLKFGGTGFLTIGWKLCRYDAPEINMLPVMSGLVPADGGEAGWISPFFAGCSWIKTGTGKYEFDCYAFVSPNSSIVATASEVGRICTATYISQGKFKVETYSRTGVPVNCAFAFFVNDPFL